MSIQKLRPPFTFDQDRTKQLKAIAPEAFADGKINWAVLEEALGEHLEDEAPSAEHFGLFWPGKREARRFASKPSCGTLTPALGESVDEERTHNIFIEGDNLEVLKLLQKSYAGEVRVIYIDPPYNTGNDFVYSDNYSDSLNNYLLSVGEMSSEGTRLTTNKSGSGRFHSNWLNMIYPRLRLARNLLTENGVIFVSIDDNELHNLKAVMNELFGEENFVAQITIQSNPRGRQSERFVATVHEYLLVYAKNAEECQLSGIALNEEQLKEFKYTDENGKKYRLLGLRQRGSASRREDRPNMYYPIYVDPKTGTISLEKSVVFSVEVFPKKSTGEDGRWMWAKKKVHDNIKLVEAKLISTRDEWDVFVRDGLDKQDGEERTRKLKTIWDEKELNYQNGTQELKELFGRAVFDFPKPTSLLQKIITMSGSEDDDLHLDFFSGSSTTAHAIFKQNLDGANRRFILVQLPEPVGDHEYPTISEIGKERIRRVSKGLKADGAIGDLGFRVYKLAPSHFKQWQDYDGEDITVLEQQFTQFETPLMDGWTKENLLTEIILQQGFPLDCTVTLQKEFAKNDVVSISSSTSAHKLYVCLDEKIDDSTVNQIKIGKRDIFVCLDFALTSEAKVRLGDAINLVVI